MRLFCRVGTRISTSSIVCERSSPWRVSQRSIGITFVDLQRGRDGHTVAAEKEPRERRGMPTTSVFDEVRDLLKRRLTEIDDERERLERALVELGERAIGRIGRGPSRSRGSGKGARRPGRRKASRAEQAVKLVEKNPGITASGVAKAIKVKPNYLYRVLGDLEKEGRIAKKGRQYFPRKKA